VIADGRQFYVRPGAILSLQDELFGDRLNVVGIIGRGSDPAVLSKVKKDDQVDWLLASQVLRSDRWVDDIESVLNAPNFTAIAELRQY
jgi:hypothetical protein